MRAATLLLLGDAGIGKSSLLDAAAAFAREREMTVLRARAVEAETALAFAGLSELLRPLTPLLGELEPAQASALAAALGALRAAAPTTARRPAEEAAARSPRSPSRSRCWGCWRRRRCGRRAALAVLVDDAHWLDDASLDALCFAARRLLHEGVVVLVAARPEPDRGLAARGLEPLRAHPARRRRRPAGRHGWGGARPWAPAPPRRRRRSRCDARRRDGGAADAAGAIDAAAAGNPLALVELTRALSDAERAGAAAAREPIRPSAAIERAYRAELAALPPATVRALLLPAADEKLPLAGIRAALAAAGLEPAALEPAERAGLLHAEQGGCASVIRCCGRSSTTPRRSPSAPPPTARSPAVLAAAGEEPDRRAWHLAAACDGPDAEVAGLLVAVAEEARARGALDAVAHALARAAELTPAAPAVAQRARPAPAADAPRARARRAALPHPPRPPAGGGGGVRGGRAAGAGAGAGARRRSPTSTLPPALRPAAQHLRGTVTMRSGQLDAGARILTEQAEAAAASDPGAGGADAARRERPQPHRRRLPGDDSPPPSGIATLAAAGGRSGARSRSASCRPPSRRPTAASWRRPTRRSPATRRCCSTPPGRAGAPSSSPGRRTSRSGWSGSTAPSGSSATLIARGRERSAVTELIYPLAVRSQLELRRGRLAAAERDAGEALRLAVETRQYSLVAIAAALLAAAEAPLGRERECREHAALSIAVCDAIGADAMGIWARAALGLLDLGLGHPQVAIAPLEQCRRHAERIGMSEPAVVQWTGDLVEALLRAGRGEEAAELLPRLRTSDTAWARARCCAARPARGSRPTAPRCSPPPATAADEAGLAFEAARARLCLGERLRQRPPPRAPRARRWRRRGRPSQAAGAAPWAACARDELRASGQPTGRPRSRRPRRAGTPHERRVALLVAEGRTNPEVAAELYITRKTVEHHLSQVYRQARACARAPSWRTRSRARPARRAAPDCRPFAADHGCRRATGRVRSSVRAPNSTPRKDTT